MEGTHGQLGPGLTDRLSGNHTNGFTVVDQTTASQVATVTLGTQAKAGSAVQRGTHLDFVDASGLEYVQLVFVQQVAGFGQYHLVFWVNRIINQGTTQYTVTQ